MTKKFPQLDEAQQAIDRLINQTRESRQAQSEIANTGRPVFIRNDDAALRRAFDWGLRMKTRKFIAWEMGCTTAAIRFAFERFPELLAAYKMGKSYRRDSIVDWQMKSAEGGNVTAQIWLGKNYADQTDKQETTVIQQKGLMEMTDEERLAFLKDLKRAAAFEMEQAERYGYTDKLPDAPGL